MSIFIIETTVVSLGGIIAGRTSIAREMELGSLFLSGDARLARTMDRWLPPSDYSGIDGIAMLPEQRGRKFTDALPCRRCETE